MSTKIRLALFVLTVALAAVAVVIAPYTLRSIVLRLAPPPVTSSVTDIGENYRALVSCRSDDCTAVIWPIAAERPI